MTYSIASVEKLEAVNKLLYASYHPDEPITKHLGLYKGLNSIPDADKRVEAMIRRNLSMFAYDKQGELIGVCINNGYYKHDFLDLLDQVRKEFPREMNNPPYSLWKKQLTRPTNPSSPSTKPSGRTT